MITCTIDDAIAVLRERQEPTFIGATLVTEPSYNKTDNPFYINKKWTIEKVTDYGGQTGVPYQTRVQNQLDREGKEIVFVAQPLWMKKDLTSDAVHIDNFVVWHSVKDCYYLKICPVAVMPDKEWYVRAETQFRYIDTLEPLTIAEMIELEKFAPAKQLPTNQGTQKPIYWNVPKFSSIKSLRFRKEIYEIR